MLPPLPEPELPQPALRAAMVLRVFVRWVVVALVPAPALEPVSPHYSRQAWHALLVAPRNKREPRIAHSLYDA